MKRRFTLAVCVLLIGCRQRVTPAPDAEGALRPIEVAPFSMGTPDAVLLVTAGPTVGWSTAPAA